MSHQQTIRCMSVQDLWVACYLGVLSPKEYHDEINRREKF